MIFYLTMLIKYVNFKYENDECVIICLHVDDMLIFATCIDIVYITIVTKI